ncbi:hypothetical protein ACR6C2_30125 [Streptomyces sp. INA 01156]
MQGTHGMNINVRGRYKHGTVRKQDYERVRAEVVTALMETLNPGPGSPSSPRCTPARRCTRAPPRPVPPT